MRVGPFGVPCPPFHFSVFVSCHFPSAGNPAIVQISDVAEYPITLSLDLVEIWIPSDPRSDPGKIWLHPDFGYEIFVTNEQEKSLISGDAELRRISLQHRLTEL